MQNPPGVAVPPAEGPIWDHGEESGFNSCLTDTVFCLFNRAAPYVNTALHHTAAPPYLVI